MNDVPITPQTKVAELLDAYPDLEAVLIGMAPVFEKLKNPVLRRTVARLASLETAAGMANLKPHELVRKLREVVGQPVDDVPGEEENDPQEAAPDWVIHGAVVATVDADALLAQGQMPLTEALTLAQHLGGSDLVCVRVSFKPVPMVDALKKQGFQTFLRSGPNGHFELLIAAPA